MIKAKVKVVLSALLVIIGVILLGNTNSNPTAFIERIFKPVKMGGAAFYYAGIFPMLLIYFGFKLMNEFGEFKLLKTRQRRIIATFIVLLFSSQLITYGIKTCKSISKDLNAIYYNRDRTNNTLSLNQNADNDKSINCIVELENCSSKVQEFYIKISVPEEYKDLVQQKELTAKEDDLKTDKKFILHPREKKIINAVFLNDMKSTDYGTSRGTNDFEFSLMNETDEVRFLKRY